MRALRAAVEIGLAARTLPGRAPGGRDGELGATARGLHHLAAAGHVEGARGDGRLPARRVLLLLLGLSLPAGFAGLVLIASLAVLAIGHGWDPADYTSAAAVRVSKARFSARRTETRGTMRSG